MTIYQFLVIERWKQRIEEAKTKDEIDTITYDMAYDERVNNVNYCTLFDFAQQRRCKLVGVAVV